jgi:heterodisulfide reductase subunit A
MKEDANLNPNNPGKAGGNPSASLESTLPEPDKNGKERIGVYICRCGTNIAQTVDVDEVVRYASTLPHVVIAKENKYMCSDPGQDTIKKDIKDYDLTRVVVSSCSPLMHEITFRLACADAGLNQFLFQMANIREQVSWVTEDKKKATEKAKRLVNAAVRRVLYHKPLERKEVPVASPALVVGGGIAGIHAALTYANSGKKVYLVEKQSSIGGHMSLLDKTFPTLDCSACILTPKMSEVGRHPNIELLTWSEVEEISGHIGSFKVKIRKKARYVDVEKCNGCGACWENCPVTITPEDRIIKKRDVVIKSVTKEQ